MENASKALLMAGGVLIALLVISLMVLGFNQISQYQKSQSDRVAEKQLAQFNEEYTQYIRDDLNGIDLVTLANKVVDFNLKNSGAGEINYNQKITLYIDMQNYQKKYSGDLFNKKIYTIKNESNEFSDIIDQYTELEITYTLKTISALSSNIESLKLYYKNGDTKYGRTMSDVLGKKITPGSKLETLENKFINKDFTEIEKYSQYSEFKTAEFKGLQPKYIDGQISELTFEYIGK